MTIENYICYSSFISRITASIIDSFFLYVLRVKSNLSNPLFVCFVKEIHHFDELDIKSFIRHYLFSAYVISPYTALLHSKFLLSKYFYLLYKVDQSPLCTISAADQHLRSLSHHIHTDPRYTKLHPAVIQLSPKPNRISFCLVCGT